MAKYKIILRKDGEMSMTVIVEDVTQPLAMKKALAMYSGWSIVSVSGA